MMKFFKNDQGFSLVQGMILAAMVAGSSLVATRLMTDQKLSQKGAESRDQIEDLNDFIYSILQNRANCSKTIVLQNDALTALNNSSHTTNVDLPFLYTSTASAATDFVIAKGRTYMNGNVTIDDMKLTFAGGVNLEIDYRRFQSTDNTRRTKNGYGPNIIRKRIPLKIQRALSGTNFESCYSVTTTKDAATSDEAGNDQLSEQLCNELSLNTVARRAFVWDATRNRCVPNLHCPTGIYTGFDSDGEVKCRNLKEWIDFSNLFDNSSAASCPTGSHIGLRVVGNKVQIFCSPTP